MRLAESVINEDTFSGNIQGGEASNDGQYRYVNSSLFPGEIYTGQTRLSRRRLIRLAHEAEGILIKEYKNVFILGYEFDKHNLFYEIWYSESTSSYFIVDKYGSIQHNNHLKHLKNAIDVLIQLISDENPSPPDNNNNNRDERDEFDRMGRGSSRRHRVAASKQLDISKMLSESAVSREMLTTMINKQIKEYHTTRMNKNRGRQFWRIFGRNPTYPSKYIGSVQSSQDQEISGSRGDGTFIIGFSLADKIDVEIWYIKSVHSGNGSFFVFDITAGEVIQSNIKTLREAYFIVARKIALPNKFDD